MNDQVSTATLNIVNDNEKWILPTGAGAVGLDNFPDELSDLPLDLEAMPGGTNTKRGNFVTPNQFAKAKRENMLKKFQAEDRGRNTIATKIIDRIQNEHLFPFLPGCPVIQMADPVRIFFKNPWKFDTDEEQWYFSFTGYIASVTEDFDAQTNRSILRIACEDIRRLLRYMRTSTNPNILSLNVVQKQGQEIITASGEADLQKQITTRASDLALVTGNAALTSGMTIVQTGTSAGVMELLLFGDTEQLNQGKGTDPAPDISGVLGFKQGGKIVVQLPVDDNFESSLSPTLDLIYPILSPETVSLYGADWALGDGTLNPDSPESNHLWVILPDATQFPELRQPFDWGMRIDFFSEWRSRLDIINEFVKNIDCIWYATPKGDIVLEFPNYDCHPHLHDDPWKSILTLQNEFTRFSSTEDDRNIKTFTIAVGSALDGVEIPGLPFLAYEPFKNWELIVRYGVREQRSNRPFHYENKTIMNALPALAAMWQGLANADAYRLEGLEMLPNFRAAPGRPYHFKFRNQICFAETIQHQIVWGELAQTVYGFKYVRHWDAIANDWQTIGGNYGWHWKPVKSSVAADSTLATSRGPNFVQARRVLRNVPFGTADQMEQMHQAILVQESSQGPMLTPEQHAEMDRITTRMGDPVNPPEPEERRALLKEFGSLVKTASHGGSFVQ
jgi:hypothetical protein